MTIAVFIDGICHTIYNLCMSWLVVLGNAIQMIISTVEIVIKMIALK